MPKNKSIDFTIAQPETKTTTTPATAAMTTARTQQHHHHHQHTPQLSQHHKNDLRVFEQHIQSTFERLKKTAHRYEGLEDER